MESNFDYIWWKDRWLITSSKEDKGIGSKEICAWLNDDLDGNNAQIALDLLKDADNREGCLVAGNAHEVFIYESFVFIECIFDDNLVVSIFLDNIINLLHNYINLKNTEPFKNRMLKPKLLSTVYEFEGNIAKNKLQKYQNRLS